MCEICAATQTFDPSRHAGGPEKAVITEIGDAPFNDATPYTMSVGDTFNGSISSSDDADAVRITLQAGVTYSITMTGGSLADTLLGLYDSGGSLITSDDDGGPGRNSAITFTATSSGTYYLGAFGFGSNTGSYTLEVTTTSAPTVPDNGTLDERADYLVNGFWDDTNRSARSFDTSSSNVITVNISALTAEGQQLARWALDAWSMVANLEFEFTTGSAQITFDNSDTSGAYNTSSTSGNTIISSTINIPDWWLDDAGTTLNSYSFQTFMHEIGHALGLGHQGNYNGNASFPSDGTFGNDSWQTSIMSYFSQSDNTTVDASFGYLLSVMMVDIIAIQNMYGAPGASSQTAGNTIWGANTNLGGYWAEIFDAMSNGTTNSAYDSENRVAFTIYDQGGKDTINLNFSTTDDSIDMRGGTFSDIAGRTGNVGIAEGTVIENLIAGSGDDTITGNSAKNKIQGRDGNDSVQGGGGRDKLLGNNGNDTLEGGGGKDKLTGHKGNDTLTGDKGADTFIFKGSNTDRDTITDFKKGTDKLKLDDKLWGGGLTKAQVISNFATDTGDDIVFNFGGGNTITLEGVANLNGLVDDISII